MNLLIDRFQCTCILYLFQFNFTLSVDTVRSTEVAIVDETKFEEIKNGSESAVLANRTDGNVTKQEMVVFKEVPYELQ